jgi:hypothetical protein
MIIASQYSNANGRAMSRLDHIDGGHDIQGTMAVIRLTNGANEARIVGTCAIRLGDANEATGVLGGSIVELVVKWIQTGIFQAIFAPMVVGSNLVLQHGRVCENDILSHDSKIYR